MFGNICKAVGFNRKWDVIFDIKLEYDSFDKFIEKINKDWKNDTYVFYKINTFFLNKYCLGWNLDYLKNINLYYESFCKT